MTTPAEAAQGAARDARRRAHRQSIAAGVQLGPAETPDEDYFREEHEKRVLGDAYAPPAADEPAADEPEGAEPEGDDSVTGNSGLEQLSKDELVAEAEERGLPKTGTKAELIERIEAHDAAEDEGDS